MTRPTITTLKPQETASSMPSGSATFDVLVLATMSAGKTSFINALIGQELLHTANEATTACMTRIEHRQGAKRFSGACYSYNDTELAAQRSPSVALLRDWNANAEVKRINLAGTFKVVPRPAPGLVLHDTPGPNNSQDASHARLMLEAVRSVSFKVLCYVLNASHLGTRDDRLLLEQLREELAGTPDQPIYFILNKVDLLDPEKGENIQGYVSNAQHYLRDIGFEQPIIIPTMASAALYARKALSAETLTRAQRSKLRQVLDDLDATKRALLNATVAPDLIKHRVFKALDNLERKQQAEAFDTRAYEKNQLHQLVTISGLKTVEALINHQRRLVGQT
ncbi:dynamin family protein [Pseudomonas borbori]|uniref:Dynamin family protein n=1 Tax=Pseudomonas borbori TaxID=289003 RepID=A0A1I5W5S5_9PSED|nr:dynamin family protein [Pseudomonas borbori]SFQ14977.1 Dynamin family protein [Pseudomonas borbori]